MREQGSGYNTIYYTIYLSNIFTNRRLSYNIVQFIFSYII